MTVIIYKHPPATIQCVSAFTKWYGMSVCDDMDIQTSGKRYAPWCATTPARQCCVIGKP